MSDVVIHAAGLSKQYRLGSPTRRYATLRESIARAAMAPLRAFDSAVRPARDQHSPAPLMWALKDATFDVKRGQVIGIIGRNGAGKTTLLKILSRITEPTEGYAEIRGRVGSLLEVGTGFHNELTGRENIFLSGAILGMKRVEIRCKFDEIVAFAEVERFIDTPLKHYSTGMYLRLAFAVAAHLEPEILVIDEVLAVGDRLFQQKCLGKMEAVAENGRTVLFVSHNMGAVRSLCTRGLVLSEGRLTHDGAVSGAIEAYHRATGAFGETNGGVGNDDRRRVGFGPVRLSRTTGNVVHQSKPFDVSTTLRFDSDIAGFTLFCVLENMHGDTLFILREDSPALGVRDPRAGDYHISVRCPALWLNPGLYALYFKVLLWREHAGARHVSDKFPVDVDGTASVTEALLQPVATWAVRCAADAHSHSPMLPSCR